MIGLATNRGCIDKGVSGCGGGGEEDNTTNANNSAAQHSAEYDTRSYTVLQYCCRYTVARQQFPHVDTV